MLRKSQRRLCYFLMYVLLMAGMYTTYVRADSFAERATSIEAAQLYAVKAANAQRASEAVFRAPDKTVPQSAVCVVESVNPVLRMVIGRTTSRNSLIRRDLRLACLLLWALCMACFILKCRYIEEILCLCEKKYRTALIKYIHDIDGKKRVSCLT